MVTIVAEKPNVAAKIAAALDCIRVNNSKTISFEKLDACEKEIKSFQFKNHHFDITYEGEECKVTWGFGHLCALKQAYDYNPAYKSWTKMPLPFIPERYEIKLNSGKDANFNDRIKKQFNAVKDLMNKSTLVINATDFDREGEAIFGYIYQYANCKAPVKRAKFSSQTKTGIIDSFKDMKTGAEMKNKENAGRVRGAIDWVVGANLSAAVTLKYPGQGIYSIGRVQTPTLALIVNRELEVRNFKPKDFWNINAEFTTSKNETYKGEHRKKQFFDKKEVTDVIQKISGKKGVIKSIQRKKVKKDIPSLYSLSALQMDANTKFGFTLEETLDIAQFLYEKGYTTYPRTDSRFLTEDMESTVNKTLDDISAITEYKTLISGQKRKFDFKKFFDNSKVTSHYAIIPTGMIPSNLNSRQQGVYDLICRSVIRMLYSPAVIENTTVVTDVCGEEFETTGSVVVEKGWMQVGNVVKEKFIPALIENEQVDGIYSVVDKKTVAPKRYTDKTLLGAMLSAGKDLNDDELRKIMSDPKTGGIGTEATRANIVKVLELRGYISRNKKTISATDKGIELIQKLPLDEVKSALLTAKWEQRLNLIETGKESPTVLLREVEDAVRKWVDEIDNKVSKSSAPVQSIGKNGKPMPNCPICGKPIIVHKWGYGCSGYKDGCKFSVGTICGKKLTENQVRDLVSNGATKTIKGFTSKNGKKFDAKLVLKDEKISFEFSN